jgi:hypothetical protein
MHRHPLGFVVIDEHDIGKTRIQLLTDLLYETNNLRIPEEKIKYGEPQALDARPDLDWDPNTFIPFRIDRDYDDRFSRNAGFMYRRRDFSEYVGSHDFEVQITHFPFRISEVLDQINAQLPFPLAISDIEDYEFSLPDTEEFELIASPKSLIWTGKCKVKMEPLDPLFFKLVPLPYLPGFLMYEAPT